MEHSGAAGTCFRRSCLRIKSFSDFEVELELPNIGRRVMILNARKIYLEDPYFKTALNMKEHFDRLILLAIEDITERKRSRRL